MNSDDSTRIEAGPGQGTICPECGMVLARDRKPGLCPGCLVKLARGRPPGGTGASDEGSGSAVRGLRIGDYEIEKEIAKGGMGIVYAARQVSLNRRVALKMIQSGRLAEASHIERFEREARLAAGLDHPHIVPIYEIGRQEGQPYFSMKLIEGLDLEEHVRGGRYRLEAGTALETQRKVAELMVKIARAVHHAHERAVLHRDLKPRNVLLDAQGEPVLTDFGLAKSLEIESSLTHSGAVMGTPAYMPPEQAFGADRDITTRSDIYSLGAIFYQLLTGTPPFDGQSHMEVLRKVVHEDPVAPTKREPLVDPDLETICLKCLEKSPDHRYESAHDLALDLERWLRNEPIHARTATIRERLFKWIRRQPWRAALWGVTVLAALVIVLLVSFVRSGEHARRLRDQFHEAQQRFVAGAPADAVARLARLVRDDPTNPAPATRLMTALMQRPFPSRELRHSNHVFGFAYAPDARHLVAACADGVARVWETSSGRIASQLTNHGDAVLHAAFSPDGQHVVTASKDRKARIWDWRRSQVKLELEHPWWVRWAGFSPDGTRVLTLSTNQARMRDLTSQKGWTQQVAGTHALSGQFSPNGRHVVVSSLDGSATVWDTVSGDRVALLKGHEGAARQAEFSPDGSLLATASDDHTARIWRLDSASADAIVLKHDGPVHAAAFYPNGSWLVTASADRTARVWDVETGQLAFAPLTHEGSVVAAACHDTGLAILTASEDGTARLWDAQSGVAWGEPAVHELAPPLNLVDQARFAPAGWRFATLCPDETVRLWPAPAAQPLFQPFPAMTEPVKYAMSPSGQAAVLLSNDTVTIWDVQTLRMESFPAKVSGLASAVFSADASVVAALDVQNTVHMFQRGRLEAVAWPIDPPTKPSVLSVNGALMLTVSGKTLTMWNTSSGKRATNPWLHEQPVAWAGWNHDGRCVASVAGRQARIWTAPWREAPEFTLDHNAQLTTGEFSADSRRLLLIADRGRVLLWTLTRRRASVLEHPGPVRAAHFLPDGRHVVTACGSEVRIWDGLDDRRPTLHIPHENEVNSVQASADGTRLVTASAAQSLQVWDTRTGLPLADPIRWGAPVWDARFTADGRWVLAHTEVSPVFWELPAGTAPVPVWVAELGEAIADRRLGQGQTPEPARPESMPMVLEWLANRSETNRYAHWARWLLTPPESRALSPSSALSLNDYLARPRIESRLE